MASDRFQRRIDRILDQIAEAVDPENGDARIYIAAADRNLGSITPPEEPIAYEGPHADRIA